MSAFGGKADMANSDGANIKSPTLGFSGHSKYQCLAVYREISA